MAPASQAPGTSGGAKQRDSSSSSRSRSKPDKIQVPPEAVFRYVLEAVEANGGVMEVPLRSENGASISELTDEDYGEPWDNLFEELEEAGIGTISFEDFFSASLGDTQYVSVPSLLTTVSRGDDEIEEVDPDGDIEELLGEEVTDIQQFLDEYRDNYSDDQLFRYGEESKGIKTKIPYPDIAEQTSRDEFDSSVTSEASRALNSWYFPRIWEKYGETSKVRLGKGKSYNAEERADAGTAIHDNEELDQLSHVAFWIAEPNEERDSYPFELEDVNSGVPEELLEQYQNGDVTLEELGEALMEEMESEDEEDEEDEE